MAATVTDAKEFAELRDKAMADEDYKDRMKRVKKSLHTDLHSIPYSTPDYPLLLDRPNWVFTYGTLMSGKPNHRLLNGTHRVGASMTVGNKFLMYKDGGTFPYVEYLDDEREAKQFGRHIYGELYQVTANDMLNLDELEGNHFHYERKKINVMWNFANLSGEGDEIKKNAKIVSAWMYFNMDELKRDALFHAKLETSGTAKGIPCYMYQRGPSQ